MGYKESKVHFEAFYLMKIIRRNLSELPTRRIEEIMSFLDENFSTIFHEPDINSIVSEVFNTKFSYELAYNDTGNLVGLCPLHSIKDNLLTMTYSNPAMYEIPYGGWVFNDDEVSIKMVMKQMKLSINEALTYWSVPQTGVDTYEEIDNKRRFQTAIIDLAANEDSIWMNAINSKRRNMIRKAQKNGVLVEKLDKDGLEDYYQLMTETYQHAGLEIKPKSYYSRVLEAYVPNAKAVILLAKVHSNIISGVILLRNKHMCHYWLGANRKKEGNLGQGEFLQWEAIKWAKENGSMYYDLCVVEHERLPQIARFKLGFAMNVVPFYLYRKRPLAYRVMSKFLR